MNEAEFDQFANDYYNQLQTSIKISGEDPEFYAEYKVQDTFRLCAKLQFAPKTILDFGSGIGNSIPWFRKYFPHANIICSDISAKSIEVSQKRFPGNEEYVKIADQKIALPNESVDVVFTTCVFHHIPSIEHELWISELRRVLKPGGLLIVFEHNPKNPITISVVKHCPFDANAVLLSASQMKVLLQKAGFPNSKISYRIFFPKFLSFFRFLEQYFTSIPLGAQYFIYAIKN
jgi:ubiquinone/menaquinone biosynthesis C-methylase UbiE